MKRIEGIIYAIGRLDEQPTSGKLWSTVDLSECHQSIEKGYELVRVNLFKGREDRLNLVKVCENDSRKTIIAIDRGDIFDVQQAAELISMAYEMYSRRHPGKK